MSPADTVQAVNKTLRIDTYHPLDEILAFFGATDLSVPSHGLAGVLSETLHLLTGLEQQRQKRAFGRARRGEACFAPEEAALRRLPR